MFRASVRGVSYVSITTRTRELAEVVDEIAVELFRYGIHSVECTREEFLINILEPPHGPGRYVNPEYTTPASPEVPRRSPLSDVSV
jgi:hypothetical protein